MRLGSLGTWAWVPRLGKSRQVEASRRLVRALVDGRFARSARRVGGWATSNNDLSNHNMRIDVTLLEDRRAVINNSIHKKIKQLQGISAYCRFKMLKYCYLRLP